MDLVTIFAINCRFLLPRNITNDMGNGSHKIAIGPIGDLSVTLNVTLNIPT